MTGHDDSTINIVMAIINIINEEYCAMPTACLYAEMRVDCETVGIPPLMSRKTLGLLDGGRGGGVDRSWRRRGIRGVDKGGA